jgi:hypothetical protein
MVVRSYLWFLQAHDPSVVREAILPRVGGAHPLATATVPERDSLLSDLRAVTPAHSVPKAQEVATPTPNPTRPLWPNGWVRGRA